MEGAVVLSLYPFIIDNVFYQIKIFIQLNKMEGGGVCSHCLKMQGYVSAVNWFQHI